MKFPSCLSCFSHKALNKSKKSSIIEPKHFCHRCNGAVTKGKLCQSCLDFINGKNTCYVCEEPLDGRNACLKCHKIRPGVFGKIYEGQSPLNMNKKIENELVTIESSRIYCDQPDLDYGQMFDLSGEYRCHFQSIPGAIVKVYVSGRKYFYSFIEVEPDYWVGLFVRVKQNTSLYQKFGYIICPTPYTPSSIQSKLIEFLKPFFVSINIINSDIHAFGFSTLTSAILACIAIQLDPLNPEKAIEEARTSWGKDPKKIIPFPRGDVLQCSFNNKAATELHSEFTRILMQNIYEFAEREKRNGLVNPAPVISSDELDSNEPVELSQEQPNNLGGLSAPLDSRVPLDETTEETVVKKVDVTIKDNYSRVNNAFEVNSFLSLFPQLRNAACFCAGSSTAYLAIFLLFDKDHRQSFYVANDTRQHQLMRAAMTIYRKTKANKEVINSFNGFREWFKFAVDLPQIYNPLQEALKDVEHVDCPHYLDDTGKVTPYLASLLDLVPNNSSHKYFGIAIANEEIPQEVAKTPLELSSFNGKEVVAFVANPSIHYLTFLKYNRNWYKMDDMSSCGLTTEKDAVDHFNFATYVVIKKI